ncbi:MAG: GGDEF domain-containing protein [Myxococcota bacterium]|nr:GGDEF domain-containing protein [Myxococcota bacterium]
MSAGKSEETLEELLDRAEDLPSLPGVAAEVLRITKDEDASLDELASALEYDPALSARILKLSNSSIFNLGSPVSTLQRAAMVLGMKTVKLVALSFSLVGGLEGGSAGQLDMRQYWRRSIACAVAARAFALRLERLLVDEAFLCGLLSRVGQLVLGRCASERYAEVIVAAGDAWPQSEHESRVFGFDGGQVAHRLLSSWELPSLLVDGVRATHDSGCLPEEPEPQLQGLSRVMSLAHLSEELICGKDKRGAMEALTEQAEACEISEEELEELLMQLESGIADAADLLDMPIRAVRVESILREARQQIVNETLSLTTEVRRLERSNRELLGEARRDALTSLPNRAAFDEALDACIEEHTSRPGGDPLGVLIFDVDHFKSVNDRFGHLVGDEVLKRVAAGIRAVVRQHEFCARYGGEEFAAILPRVTPEGLLAAAERIREAVARLEMEHEGQELSITVSVGGAYATKVGGSVPNEAILDAADRCLYKAKRSGRNRSCVAAADAQ